MTIGALKDALEQHPFTKRVLGKEGLVGSVAGPSVLYQLHEMVDTVAQEEHFVALGHSIRVHLVEDGGADVLILDGKRDTELDREAA